MFFNLTLIPKIAPKSQKIDPKDQKKSAKEALNMARDGSRGGEWGDAPPHRTQDYKGKSCQNLVQNVENYALSPATENSWIHP